MSHHLATEEGTHGAHEQGPRSITLGRDYKARQIVSSDGSGAMGRCMREYVPITTSPGCSRLCCLEQYYLIMRPMCAC